MGIRISAIDAALLRVYITERIDDAATQKLKTALAEHPASIPVALEINTDGGSGGDWPAAIDAARILMEHAGTVSARIENACGASLLLAMSAEQVEVAPEASCCLQEPDVYEALPSFDPHLDIWTALDLESLLNELQSVTRQGAELVAQRSGMELHRVLCMMRADLHLFGDECAQLFSNAQFSVADRKKGKRRGHSNVA